MAKSKHRIFYFSLMVLSILLSPKSRSLIPVSCTTWPQKTMQIIRARWTSPLLGFPSSIFRGRSAASGSRSHFEFHCSQVEKFPLCYDNWSYATLVAEIGQWCYKSFKMGVPLSRSDKDRYCTKRVRDLPAWIEDLNPKLHEMIRECWNPEPTLRPSFSDLLRELAIARVMARQTDKTLNLELPSSANGKNQ